MSDVRHPRLPQRDGSRYRGVHHLFHLAYDPPADCLSPEYVVVLCANCHRRMHYADVGIPEATNDGWFGSGGYDGNRFCDEMKLALRINRSTAFVLASEDL